MALGKAYSQNLLLCATKVSFLHVCTVHPDRHSDIKTRLILQLHVEIEIMTFICETL